VTHLDCIAQLGDELALLQRQLRGGIHDSNAQGARMTAHSLAEPHEGDITVTVLSKHGLVIRTK
jgi:hypothetical protein